MEQNRATKQWTVAENPKGGNVMHVVHGQSISFLLAAIGNVTRIIDKM
jgi:hypothetical protein